MNDDSAVRLARARAALEGVAVGDSLGERFFGRPEDVAARIARRELPQPPWRYTDDTEQAVHVVAELTAHGEIDPARLLARLANGMTLDRGYGAATRDYLHDVRHGLRRLDDARLLFDGAGSCGNGAAMRAAPVGAWHASDVERAIADAARSALSTHTHPEGVAGAIAVVAAAALAAGESSLSGGAFLATVAQLTPPSAVRDGVERARLLVSATPEQAAAELGSGREITAQDTVPFALWAAAGSLDDYVGVFWRCVAGLGDRDTTCAIAGGITASRVGMNGIPQAWREAHEPLPSQV